MEISQHLLKGCIRGDRLSQRALYEDCAPYIYGVVKNYIRDVSFRKDAMQEAFAHIFSSLSKYDPKKGEFKTWIARIAANQCVNILKKTGKINLSDGLEIVKDLVDFGFERLNELTKEDIENMLTKMPSGYKTVFLLFVFDDHSHKDIASLLEITPETSRSQLSRALSWIRKNIMNKPNSFSYEAL